MEGFSTTTPRRIIALALLCGRMDDPLHVDGGDVGISQAFVEILGLVGRPKLWHKQENVGDQSIMVPEGWTRVRQL